MEKSCPAKVQTLWVHPHFFHRPASLSDSNCRPYTVPRNDVWAFCSVDEHMRYEYILFKTNSALSDRRCSRRRCRGRRRRPTDWTTDPPIIPICICRNRAHFVQLYRDIWLSLIANTENNVKYELHSAILYIKYHIIYFTHTHTPPPQHTPAVPLIYFCFFANNANGKRGELIAFRDPGYWKIKNRFFVRVIDDIVTLPMSAGRNGNVLLYAHVYI